MKEFTLEYSYKFQADAPELRWFKGVFSCWSETLEGSIDVFKAEMKKKDATIVYFIEHVEIHTGEWKVPNEA